MFIAYIRSLRVPLAVVALAVALVSLNAEPAAATEVIVLRSGNAPMGNPDPLITMLAGPGGAPLSANPFTPGDFDQAYDTIPAIVTQPHPLWLQHLDCDPQAQWIGIDGVATPGSALYCYTFRIETPCIEQANLSFCWAADDYLGDVLAGGPNPDGVYLNGVAVSPSIFGGNYATETLAPLTDVTSLVSPGTNRLEVYDRDGGFSVSGVMFSATLEVEACSTPAENSTWGQIKSLFQ
jgi:hypothetical protein